MTPQQDHDLGVRSQEAGQLLDTLGRLVRTSRTVSHRQSGEYGLSGTPIGILKALASGDTRSGDLAVRLQIAPSVASRAVTALQQEGLVERRTDPEDARAVRLGLTRAGRRRLDEARRTFVERLIPLLEDWDSTDITVLTRLMDRLESTISDGFDPRGQDSTPARRPVHAIS